MTSATLSTPTTAERVRSACVHAAGAILAADSVPPAPAPIHHLMPDGSFALTVPSDSAMARAATQAGADGVAAVLELTDYAPLPLREPVRSLVWVRGQVHPVPSHAVREMVDMIAIDNPDPALLDIGAGQSLLLLGADSVVVADATGAEPVAVADLLAAQPDPFCEFEAAWLQHLDKDHPEVLNRLAGSCPQHCVAARCAHSGWTATGFGYAWKARMGTTTSGCPSPTRWPTSVVWAGRSGC